MGPQLFSSVFGLPNTIQQTGPSPLQVLLSTPVQFVKESVPPSVKRGASNDLLENAPKRRKVMSLAEYKARKAGTEYISPLSKDGAIKEEGTFHRNGIKNSSEVGVSTGERIASTSENSSECSTPERETQAVPHIGIPGAEIEAETKKATNDVKVLVPVVAQDQSEKPRPEAASIVQEPFKEDVASVSGSSEISKSLKSPENSRKRSCEASSEESQTPLKKAKTEKVESAIPKKTQMNGSPLVNNQILNTSLLQTKVNISVDKVNKNSEKFWKEFPLSHDRLVAKGINNKGLWCYRNSVIQALVHVPAIFDFLTNQHTQEKCPQPGKGCICCLLRVFTRNHFGDERATNNKQRTLEMIDKILGGEFARTGFRHEQQDADEYVVHLLDKAVEQLKNGKKNIKTPLEDLLEITTTQSVVCRNPKCKHRSQTKSRSNSVRAKMPRAQQIVQLDGLVNDLTAPEIIKDYKCEKCGKLGATIKRKFAELPPALMVHVNRGGKPNFRGQAIKLNNWLQFEPEMTLETNDGELHQYELRSVVSHIGQSLNSGHYVCFGRNPNGSTWSMCDDSNVSTIPESKFRGGKDGKPRFSAYILMYAKT
ncbi:hypothetical protein BDZ91DRAFT_722512 [Kalaharituber pfeilii]|nr:hypothetical protein BDZ91DRAFT_722512 [Kalaharituber pfeilii]